MRWHFMDKIEGTDEKTWIKSNITFPLDQEWHEDHFPSNPVVPGVLQIEVGAQTLGELILLRALNENKKWEAPLLLKTEECVFKEIVRPGEKITVEMKIDKWSRKIVRGSGQLSLGNKLLSTLSLTLVRTEVKYAGDPDVLIPWRANHLEKVYSGWSPTVKKILEEALKSK